MANCFIAVLVVLIMSMTTTFVISSTFDIVIIGRVFCGTIIGCIAVYVIGFIIGYSTLSAKRLFILYGLGKNNKEA